MKMGQNKLEGDFRKKLTRREIEPSADAWNRLDAMLDAAEVKKSKNYNWLYIAAAIATFLLVGTIFFSNERSRNNTETGVVIEENVNPARPESAIDSQTNSKTNISEPYPSAATDHKESVATQQIKKPSTKKESINFNHTKTESIAAIQDKTPGIQSINQKESINIQNSPEINPGPVTEVDQMLAAATSDQTPKKRTLKVDPNSLLSQVDGELELSFREKVINSVSKNYQEVKVALANRNIE